MESMTCSDFATGKAEDLKQVGPQTGRDGPSPSRVTVGSREVQGSRWGVGAAAGGTASGVGCSWRGGGAAGRGGDENDDGENGDGENGDGENGNSENGDGENGGDNVKVVKY